MIAGRAEDHIGVMIHLLHDLLVAGHNSLEEREKTKKKQVSGQLIKKKRKTTYLADGDRR